LLQPFGVRTYKQERKRQRGTWRRKRTGKRTWTGRGTWIYIPTFESPSGASSRWREQQLTMVDFFTWWTKVSPPEVKQRL